MQTNNDLLWETAQRRACFKKNLFTYVVICTFLWAVWFASAGGYGHFRTHAYGHIPWPVWISLFWGIGLAVRFAELYLFHTTGSVEAEYRKLKNRSH